MHQSKSHLFWAFLLIISSNFPIFAIRPYHPDISDPLLEPWRWQMVNELNGMGFRCMVEAKDHTLWFGVEAGVLHYDGKTWRLFTKEDGLASVPVSTLYVTSDSVLYAGGCNALSRFVHDAWEPIRFNFELMESGRKVQHRLFSIIETSDGSVWAATRQGALRIQGEKMTMYRFDAKPAELKVAQDGENVFDEKDSHYTNNVYCIFEEKNKALWFGMRNGRIYRGDFIEGNLAPYTTWHLFNEKEGFETGGYSPIITKTPDGTVYIANGAFDKGLQLYKSGKVSVIHLSRMFSGDDIVSSMIETQDGCLLLGGFSRLYAYKEGKWKVYERPQIPIPATRCILYETSDGSLWLGGLMGDVWRIDYMNSRWTTYEGLNYQAQGRDGKKWFLSRDGGIVCFQPDKDNWIRYGAEDGLIDMPVTILVTRAGDVWAAGSHHGVAATAVLNGERWQIHEHQQLSWGIDARCILESRDGSIWFGACTDLIPAMNHRGGLAQFRPSLDPTYPEGEWHYEYHLDDQGAPRLAPAGVYGIGESSDGYLWVGQWLLSKFREGVWTPVTDLTDLNSDYIDCITTDPSGKLWISIRSNGVFRYEPDQDTWAHFTTKNGLSSNNALYILAENDSSVWIATENDICHYDGSSWSTYIFPSRMTLTREGGSIKRSYDGAIWINQNSRTWYRRARTASNPAEAFQNFRTFRYQPEKQPPETEIIRFPNQEKVSQPGNVLLSWKGFDPYNATPSNELQYSYRMDQGEWSVFSSNNNHVFLAMADGSHTFEVRARDRDFNVDPTPAQMIFKVRPPLWKEPVFILLAISFLISIIVFEIRLFQRNKLILKADQIKLRLFTNISHELRTPLTLILGPLKQIIESGEGGERIMKKLKLMNRNALRLMRLINQVLDFRKLEAGNLELMPVRGEIVSFARHIFDSFKGLSEQKEIEYRFKTDLEELWVWFDPDKLDKMLFNLLSNAFKFTPQKGRISLAVLTDKERDSGFEDPVMNEKYPNGFVDIQVRDSGYGISEEKIPYLFQWFYQVHDAPLAEHEGTGIGLALVKEFTELHHGEIFVKSKKDGGSIFTVRLPLGEKHLPEKQVSEQKDISPVQVFEEKERLSEVRYSNEYLENKPGEDHPVIEVIDDNQDMRSFIREDLESSFQIIEADGGLQGIELAIEQIPDVIVCDIMMPDLSGIELCRKLKTDERTSHIPIIFLTALSSETHKIQGLATGADDYLTKPFSGEELKIRIHNMIESRRILRERFSSQIRVEPANIIISSVEEKFLKRAMEKVELHMDDAQFGVGILSQEMQMSRIQLYRKIKALTGQHVNDFITTLRLKRATNLLIDSGMNITEVAFAVGFKDSSHFARSFRKEYGESPKNYINKHFQ